MHVGHMASHVCGTWQAMCVTHGMPCVIMHGHVKTYKYEIVGGGGGGGGGGAANAVRGTAASSVRGSSKEEEEEEGRKGEEKVRKGKEKGRRREEKERRKEKKKGEEEKKKKEENEGGLLSEQTRTEKNPELRYKRQVSSYSGYFTPRDHVMAYGFRPIFFGRIWM